MTQRFRGWLRIFLACAVYGPLPASAAFTDGSPAPDIKAQFTNPSDILSVLMVIGGDIVQKALAQVTGHGSSSVCFSFGWVAYSFLSVVNLLGDGRLMPTPDYPCKVINMKSGHPRENKSWVIGRLLRDNELFMSNQQKGLLREPALRISVYHSMPLPSPSDAKLSLLRASFFIPFEVLMRRVTLSGYLYLVILAIQIGVACIPWILFADWSIFLVTMAGTYMASLTTRLPQWKAEKFGCRKKSTKIVAVTAGNGSKDVMIIKGLGESPDLEDLAAPETPRLRRPWQTWGVFTRKPLAKLEDEPTHVHMFQGLPTDFWLTRLFCVALLVGWIALLILVAGLRSNTWFLLIIGGLGMFQNAFVAGCSLDPQEQPIPLLHTDTIIGYKVLDALMDLEIALGDPVVTSNGDKPAVQPLLSEFFPNGIRFEDGGRSWWEGERKEYDDRRCEEQAIRGTPRSVIMEKLKLARLGRVGDQRYIIQRPELEGQNIQV